MAAESDDSIELTPEDKKYLKQIAQDHKDQQGAVDEQGRTWTLGKLMGMGFTRRDAMAILSGIAVGIPFSQAVMRRVAAAASTSDSDGNVGLPSDRVDVFADGMDIAADLVDDDGNTIIDESGPSIGTSSDPVSSVHTDELKGTGSPYSLADDFSDVSVYQQRQNPGSQTTYTLLDVSDGPKVVQLVQGDGYWWADKNNNRRGSWLISRDGTSTVWPPSSVTGNWAPEDTTGDATISNSYPLIYYDSSFKVEWLHGGTSDLVVQTAYVKGSGPHFAVVVADGEGPYSTAQNVNDEQIEAMNAPDGYKVVKNPAVADDVSSIWDAVWDADTETFV